MAILQQKAHIFFDFPTIQTMTPPPLLSGITGVFAVWICFAGAECLCVCGVLQC